MRPKDLSGNSKAAVDSRSGSHGAARAGWAYCSNGIPNRWC